MCYRLLARATAPLTPRHCCRLPLGKQRIGWSDLRSWKEFTGTSPVPVLPAFSPRRAPSAPLTAVATVLAGKFKKPDLTDARHLKRRMQTNLL